MAIVLNDKQLSFSKHKLLVDSLTLQVRQLYENLYSVARRYQTNGRTEYKQGDLVDTQIQRDTC